MEVVLLASTSVSKKFLGRPWKGEADE